VSFNLINEPDEQPDAPMTRDDYKRVVKTATEAIHKTNPDRLMIADGVPRASAPCLELADVNVAQSCRVYTPTPVSHYKVESARNLNWPEPVWPGLKDGGRISGRKALEEYYRPWAELASRGIGVHSGEGGAYNKTPHPAVLAWLEDAMEILKQYNTGYALWGFRGPFGVLDSGRADVEYEDFHGHRLDRKLLELLRKFSSDLAAGQLVSARTMRLAPEGRQLRFLFREPIPTILAGSALG
jgi:endoglucanase